MTLYFLDSSALVKRYITELGSNWLRGIVAPLSNNRLFIASITQTEIMSAVMRRHREGHISVRTARAIRLYLERHTQREYNILPLSAPVNQRAQDLLELYALRAADAIQLATAIEAQNRVSSSGLPHLTFVSADNRLLSAAIAQALATDDPNQHP